MLSNSNYRVKRSVHELCDVWARRSLQGEPCAAVLHRRARVSSGGHRLKLEHSFQLLSPGVPRIKYASIWRRMEAPAAPGVRSAGSGSPAAAAAAQAVTTPGSEW